MRVPGNPPRSVLPRIVVGQLLATSLWFAPNAVVGALRPLWGISGGEGLITTAVQLGFICGTLVFALLALSDRFHASRVFLVCALGGAAANVAVLARPDAFTLVLVLRFLVGFSLAGVYPVGMKIASGWYGGGLGQALGWLVGALVLGTAGPHLLKALGQGLPWELVVVGSSLAALAGGVLVAAVPEGPDARGGQPVRFGGVFGAFRAPRFRAAVLGYFGHMWELYALWAFIPVWAGAQGLAGAPLSLAAFYAIAAGGLGCVAGGYLARVIGSERVALGALAVSGACCLVSPLLFGAPSWLLLPFLGLWGLAAAADSPQFSALNAASAPPGLVGSALTLANCGGFAISIVSLSLLEWLQFRVEPVWLMLPLAAGPLAGLIFARGLTASLSGAVAPGR